MDVSLILGNLLTPQILFFFLGVVATLARSDLEIPQPVTRALSLYLLFSIGLHGGVELARAGFNLTTLTPLVGGMVASALFPIVSFLVLRRRLGAADAAAIAATYGSISAVTFITATSFLDDRGVRWSGHMVAAMALMESPAILVGVLLARRFRDSDEASDPGSTASFRSLLHEAFTNGAVFLLLGSLAIGALTGEKGWVSVEPFAYAPFKGALCLFLLDMGLIAARRLRALRESGPLLIGYSVLIPFIHAAIALPVARLLSLSQGDALLFLVLCASASYIAVPAALRISLPQANPSLYLPMALGLTFPVNIAIGIPLYYSTIEFVWRMS